LVVEAPANEIRIALHTSLLRTSLLHTSLLQTSLHHQAAILVGTLVGSATMGGGASTIGTESIRREWMDVFKAMKLQHREVKTMFAIYSKVDSDRSGTIDVVELLTLLDIERTAFTERIFSAFDKDHTGKIDFYEFVVSLWKFCTLGNGSLCKIAPRCSLLLPYLTFFLVTDVFAFDLYDTNADGKLACEQVQKMFLELFGSKAMESETAKA
jgi:Ca2+-binding EF-hand superfamily protein